MTNRAVCYGPDEYDIVPWNEITYILWYSKRQYAVVCKLCADELRFKSIWKKINCLVISVEIIFEHRIVYSSVLFTACRHDSTIAMQNGSSPFMEAYTHIPHIFVGVFHSIANGLLHSQCILSQIVRPLMCMTAAWQMFKVTRMLQGSYCVQGLECAWIS